MKTDTQTLEERVEELELQVVIIGKLCKELLTMTKMLGKEVFKDDE